MAEMVTVRTPIEVSQWENHRKIVFAFIQKEGPKGLSVAVRYWMRRFNVPVDTYDDVFSEAKVFLLEKINAYDPSQDPQGNLVHFLFQWTRFAVLHAKEKQIMEVIGCTRGQYNTLLTLKRDLRRQYPLNWEERFEEIVAREKWSHRVAYQRLCHGIPLQRFDSDTSKEKSMEEHFSWVAHLMNNEREDVQLQVERMRVALSHLRAKDKWIISQRFFEGKSFAEIAQGRNVSRQRIQQLLRKALACLADQMKSMK